MKSLEELGSTITTTSIAELVPKIILGQVEEAARNRRWGRNLVRINDDLTRTKGRSIIVGRRGTLTASDVSEGTTMGGNAITYTSKTLVPTKVGASAFITEEAIEGAELNLIQDSVAEAGIALADKEDLDILKALLNITVGTTTFSSGTNTNTIGSKLLWVDETVSGVSAVDYYDGKITCVGAATVDIWTSSESASFIDVDGKGTLAVEDVIDAVVKVKGNKWNPVFLVVHPNAIGNLIKSTSFMDAAKYATVDTILTGEIGKIAGLRVLATTQIKDSCAMVVDPSRAGWMAVRRSLDMKRWDNPATDSVELYFYTEYTAKLTDADAIAFIVNFTAKSADI